MADINLTAAQVAQIILSVGDTSQLNTADKSTLVAAINELAGKITVIKSVDKLPDNPDPNVLYLIREEDTGGEAT